MKCLVLISLALNTLLKINAQDNKTQTHLQQYDESEYQHTSSKPLLSYVKRANDSFVQKIKKTVDLATLNDFKSRNFSSEHFNEAFNSFDTPLSPSVNLIKGEKNEKEEIESKLFQESSVEKSGTTTSFGEEPLDENQTTSNPIDIDTNKEIDLLNPRPNEIVKEQLDLNATLDSKSSGANDDTSEINIRTLSEELDREYPDLLIPVTLPQNNTGNDTTERAITETLKDSVSEGSNLGKEKIIRSETKGIFNTKKNAKFDRVVKTGNRNTTKTGKKSNNTKRYSSDHRNVKTSRKSSKNKKPVVNNNVKSESKSSSKTYSTTQAPHIKQDRRMVYEGLNYQTTNRGNAEYQYHRGFEPINFYAHGYPHGHKSHQDYAKPLFQPSHVENAPPQDSLSHFEPIVKHVAHRHDHATSSHYFEKNNRYGPVSFRHDIDHGTPVQHTKHTHEDQEITVTKEIPAPYTVKVEKEVLYPVYVKVPYDKPYPVYVPKPYKVVHEVLHPYNLNIKVPKPYEVIKHFPKPVKVPVDRPYPVEVPKPYHVTVEKKVPVTVEKPVPYPVHVPVDKPFPVHVPITKHVPYTVEKRVPVTVQVPVDKPYPVYIPKPYAVHVPKPVPHTVEKYVPYPVKVPVKYPVKVPVPFEVIKEIPVHEHKHDHHTHSHY